MSERLLRRAEVEAQLGLSRSRIYVLMRAGELPEPIRVGQRAVRWRASEIDAWIADRPRASGDSQQAA